MASEERYNQYNELVGGLVANEARAARRVLAQLEQFIAALDQEPEGYPLDQLQVLVEVAWGRMHEHPRNGDHHGLRTAELMLAMSHTFNSLEIVQFSTAEVYVTGLLHDYGKFFQEGPCDSEDNEDHGKILAKRMSTFGFPHHICLAIAHHEMRDIQTVIDWSECEETEARQFWLTLMLIVADTFSARSDAESSSSASIRSMERVLLSLENKNKAIDLRKIQQVLHVAQCFGALCDLPLGVERDTDLQIS